jgi:hypothetical protein
VIAAIFPIFVLFGRKLKTKWVVYSRKCAKKHLKSHSMRRLRRRIVWDHRRRAFTMDGRLISGLLPQLQRLLYPDYSWEVVRANTPTQTRPKNACSSTYRTLFHGKANGSKLDRQLHVAVQFAHDHSLPCCVFFDSKKRRLARQSLPQRTATRLERLASHLLPPALNFFRMCHLKQLTPQFSQVTVGDVRARVATRVDIKCVNEHGQTVLIENKVGYNDGTYMHGNSRMRPPFAARVNSAYNQHQIQLALTEAMYQRQFSTHTVAESYVWRFDETGVSSFPLQAWARQEALTVLNMIETS